MEDATASTVTETGTAVEDWISGASRTELESDWMTSLGLAITTVAGEADGMCLLLREIERRRKISWNWGSSKADVVLGG